MHPMVNKKRNNSSALLTKTALFGLAALIYAPSALALDDLSSCTQLSDREPVTLETGIGEVANSCFVLPGSNGPEELNITSMTEASFAHQLNVYEVNGGGAELIGSYDSNDISLTQVSLPSHGHNIAVEVLPLERDSGKRIVAQYLVMGSTPQMVLEVYNQ